VVGISVNLADLVAGRCVGRRYRHPCAAVVDGESSHAMVARTAKGLVALVAALVVVGWFVFVVSEYPLGFLCIPICAWAGGRFGQREAATVTCLFSLVALWGTVHGFGTFGRESVNDALLLTQGFLAVTSVIGLVVGAAVSGRNIAEESLRRAYAELRMNYERIRQLAGRLISAEEATRADISRDLHDDVCEELVCMSLAASSLKRSSGDIQDSHAQLALSERQQRTVVLVEGIRGLSHNLHPSVLRLVGLASALEAHCIEVEKRHDVQVGFKTEGDLGHVDRRDGNGLGLVSMEERAHVVGGDLQIITRPGQGTTIRVRIPAGAYQGAEKGHVHEAVRQLAAYAPQRSNEPFAS